MLPEINDWVILNGGGGLHNAPITSALWTRSAQVVNGIAECPDIPLSGPALGLTLQATCPANAAIQPATSSPFDRTARLAFRELPAVVEAQSELTVEVVVRDWYSCAS